MRPLIELVNVHKDYLMGKVLVRALRGLSIKIHQGEFVAIVGSSGSGKSTAMHIMGCLDVPTKGKVLFEGKDISKLDSDTLSEIRRDKIGFVFQDFNLMPGMSSVENVLFPTIFRKESKEEFRQRAVDLLNEVGLGSRLEHKPSELSGGEQQRIAIARSLINNPEILLADEPTGNLDSSNSKNVIDYFKKINSKGMTIVIVTHDMKIASMADRIIKVKDGALA